MRYWLEDTLEVLARLAGYLLASLFVVGFAIFAAIVTWDSICCR